MHFTGMWDGMDLPYGGSELSSTFFLILLQLCCADIDLELTYVSKLSA